jgi:hypothetical protein
MIRDAEDIL